MAVIYQDLKMKVEIADWFDELLDEMVLKSVQLDKKHLDNLMAAALCRLKKAGWNFEGMKLHISSNAPIIEKDKAIEFNEPFDIMSFFFQSISEVSELSHTELIDLFEAIELYYEQIDIKCFCDLFETRPFGIDGFIAIEKANNLIVCAFSFGDSLKF